MKTVQLSIDKLAEFQAKTSKSVMIDAQTGEHIACRDGQRIIMYVDSEPDFSSESAAKQWQGTDLSGKPIILTYAAFSKIQSKLNSVKFNNTRILLATKR